MISRAASPIACTPVAQAVTAEWFGPLKPYLIETCPEARLISADGMKNGDSRRARPSCTWMDASNIVCSPPMPEPIITPVAQRSSSASGVHPESSTASLAAPRALLVQQCSQDKLFPEIGMKESVEKVAAVYEKAGAKGQFDGRFYDEPHRFTRAMQDDAFAWFDRRFNHTPR